MLNGFKHNNNLIIINADDFGYDLAINQAIYKSFQLGLIHSSSVFVNMDGFEDATDIIRSDHYISRNVGLHINLTEGYPVADAIKSCKRFCDESGKFFYTRQKPIFRLTGIEKTAVYEEMVAQMELLLRAGVHPSHLDSHHHVHTEWPILKLVIILAKKYSIQNIRPARNMGLQRSLFKMVYKSLLNNYLKYRVGMANADLFGNLDDFEALMKNTHTKGKSIEIMVHPNIDQRQDIIDDNGNNLNAKLVNIISDMKTIYHFAGEE